MALAIWKLWSTSMVFQGKTYTAEGTPLLPVVAHRLKHGIVKLNGPRNEQRRVRWLRRHVG